MGKKQGKEKLLAKSSGDKLRDVIRRILQDPNRKIDLRLFARELGVGYRSLMYWIGNDPERRFPADLLVPLCELLNTYEPLDFLEAAAGRLAFPLPKPGIGARAGVINVQLLMKEMAEALGSLCQTLEDGVVEEHEAQATMAELDDVTRQCALLRHWLSERSRSDAKPKSPQRRRQE